MNVNVGTVDRAVRVVAGLVLIGLAIVGTIGVWGYIGILPLATAALGRCPLYSIFGITTCGRMARE